MFAFTRRQTISVGLALAIAASTPAFAQVSEIRVDYATYNPLSLVIREQKLLEKEFEKDKINIRWVLSAGSNKALEFLNAGSLDIGSTAGAAALVGKINGNPIKTIGSQGQKDRGYPRHRSAHLPRARARQSRPD
jgi:sulfonate transport system substrate-binding protein